MRLSGLVSHAQKEDVVVKASGLSRGDKSRNARLERLRQLVPVANAIVGIDLADAKQMVVVTDHDSRVLARRTFRCRAWDLGGDLARTRRLGLTRLEILVRKEVTRWGATKPTLRITRNLFAALSDNAGVLAHRRGALEGVGFVLDDWSEGRRRRRDTEQRMTAVLDELGLTALVTSIQGLSAVGAAAILAKTGNPHRFTSARALVKHAGLAPRERSSGAFTGRTKVTGQGRPSLRLAAWRGIWGTLRNNPVHAARYAHLIGREHNRLKPTQAQAAVAAALLRQLHAVITTGRAWNAQIATHGTRRTDFQVAA